MRDALDCGRATFDADPQEAPRGARWVWLISHHVLISPLLPVEEESLTYSRYNYLFPPTQDGSLRHNLQLLEASK
jgi:hypothetical protein